MNISEDEFMRVCTNNGISRGTAKDIINQIKSMQKKEEKAAKLSPNFCCVVYDPSGKTPDGLSCAVLQSMPLPPNGEMLESYELPDKLHEACLEWATEVADKKGEPMPDLVYVSDAIPCMKPKHMKEYGFKRIGKDLIPVYVVHNNTVSAL